MIRKGKKATTLNVATERPAQMVNTFYEDHGEINYFDECNKGNLAEDLETPLTEDGRQPTNENEK